MKAILFACFCIFSFAVNAQQLSGAITDAANATAIASATVEIAGSTTLQSDHSGLFSIRRIKPGSYTVRISAVGYQSYTGTAVVPGERVLVSLKRIDLFLEAVEVKAIRAAANAPFAKTEISKSEIGKRNMGQDIPYLLNQTPSVVISSDAGNGVGYTGLRIRGSDATRINLTINGIPYNDAESQGSFFVNLPDLASSVDHIQVQRGVGASSNGAGAFGATINFSTNEAITSPYAEINNSYGSFNTWKNTVKAGSGLIGDHFTIDSRLSRISSDGYVDRASSNLGSFYLSGAYLSENTSLRVNVISGKEKTYQAWNGIPESDLANNRRKNYSGTEKPGTPYDNETDNYQQDHYQLFFNHRFSKNTEFNTALFWTKGKGYYEQYRAKESYADYGLDDFVAGGDTIAETDLISRLWLDNDFYGQIASLQYKTDKSVFTAGGGWNVYKGRHFGEIIWAEMGVPADYRWYNLHAKKTDVNGYTKFQHQIAKGLEVFADLQYRNVTYNLGGFRKNPTLRFDNNYHFFNPKIGLSYSQKELRYYLSYSMASKEPNRDDFEAGILQQPKPERLRDVEAGMEQKRAGYTWSAGIFYMNYKDQLIPTGKINDVGANTRINIPYSYRAGIELQGKFMIVSWADVSANLTLSRNRIKNFTEYYDDYDNGGQKSMYHAAPDIAFSPAVVGAASLNIRPFNNIGISLIGKYVNRQYLDNTGNAERSIHPYYVQDARISYTLPAGMIRNAVILFQVNNVFNKKYEANGYTFSYQSDGSLTTENYYFPMAGTNLMFALNIAL